MPAPSPRTLDLQTVSGTTLFLSTGEHVFYQTPVPEGDLQVPHALQGKVFAVLLPNEVTPVDFVFGVRFGGTTIWEDTIPLVLTANGYLVAINISIFANSETTQVMYGTIAIQDASDATVGYGSFDHDPEHRVINGSSGADSLIENDLEFYVEADFVGVAGSMLTTLAHVTVS